MYLFRIISAPAVGNIVGIASLFIGIISLIWTIVTYRMTKRIEKKLLDAKARAINKKRFTEYRLDAINTLKSRQNTVKEAGKISKSLCNEIVVICNRIKGYEQELCKDDYDKIELLYEKLVSLTQDKNLIRDKGMLIFIEITSGLISILEKGEYDV